MIIVSDPYIINEKKEKDGISAIMRIKNGEDYLEQTINTIANQVNEIICIFNDSNDNTEKILVKLEKKFPAKIKVFKYVPKVFPPGSKEFKLLKEDSFNSLVNYYNFALSKATYKYIFKLDDDQLYFPEIIKNIKKKEILWDKFCVGLKGINLFDHYEKLYINKNNIFTNGTDILFFKYNETCKFTKSMNCEKFVSNLQIKEIIISFYHTKFCKKDRGINNYNIEQNNIYYKKVSDAFFNNVNLIDFEVFNEKKKYINPVFLGFKFINNSIKQYNCLLYNKKEKEIKTSREVKSKIHNNFEKKKPTNKNINVCCQNIKNAQINNISTILCMKTIIKNINQIMKKNCVVSVNEKNKIIQKSTQKKMQNIGNQQTIKNCLKQNKKENVKKKNISLNIETKQKIKNPETLILCKKKINISSNINLKDRICIVGNGKSIFDKEYGEKIDEFDCVIRCNIPTFTKNSKYIGKKTDVLFSYFNLHYKKILDTTNKTYVKDYINEYKFINNATVVLQYNEQIKYGDENIFYDFHKKNDIYFLQLNDGVLKYYELIKIIKEYNLPELTSKPININSWCSTGLLAILFVILNKKKPYIYGFDINEKYEYYNVLFENYYKVVHDFEFERNYIFELIKYNYLSYLD